MAQIELSIKPIRTKPDALEMKEALKWALYGINIEDILSTASKKLKAFLMSVKKFDEKKAQEHMNSFLDDFKDIDKESCPVQTITEVDTSSKDETKIKIEINDDCLSKGEEDVLRNDFFIDAIGAVLLKAEKTKVDWKDGEEWTPGRKVVDKIVKITIPEGK